MEEETLQAVQVVATGAMIGGMTAEGDDHVGIDSGQEELEETTAAEEEATTSEQVSRLRRTQRRKRKSVHRRSSSCFKMSATSGASALRP